MTHTSLPALFTQLAALSLLMGCSGDGSGAAPYTDNLDDYYEGGSGGGQSGEEPGDNPTTALDPEGKIPDVPEPIDDCPTDECAYSAGIKWRCQTRFAYGTNMSWGDFASDFGGLEDWGRKSISQDPVRYSEILADMKAHGVNLVRWWMFPDFRGDGVLFDEAGLASGVTDTVLEDLTTVLELAQAHDIYLMLTLFSFDNFKPTQDGRPYMTPIALDSARRAALVENVVRPIAAQVEASEYKIRMHSWDLINEPEWAILGPSLYDPDSFLANDTGTDPISHGEMEQFLAEINTVVRQESSALISVGASLKWPQAWTGLDTDFHQLHYYPWMDEFHPLDRTPAEIGLTDKPVMLGEFPGADKWSADSKYSYAELTSMLYKNGWAGALGWDWNDSTANNKLEVKAFADSHSCETAY